MRLLWIFLPIFSALAECGPSSRSSSTQQTVKNVLVTKALSKDVPVQLYEFGRIAAPETVDVKPQVSGRITEVHFKEGQDVKKGDLLFVIDPRPFQADLEQAQAQLQSDSAQLDLNQNNLQRDKKIGTQHFVSEQQIDTDKANVKNFQGAVGRDQASIDRAKLNLEYCYVRSPIDGRTGRRLVDAGNYVATGAVSLVNIQRQDLFVVRTDNTVEQRLVTQGVGYRDFVVVAEGLKADETVVVEGQLTIGNGAKANPAPYRGGIPGGSPSASGLTQSQNSGDSSGQVDPPPRPNPTL